MPPLLLLHAAVGELTASLSRPSALTCKMQMAFAPEAVLGISTGSTQNSA